jgi:hypothetical protein
LWIVAAVAKWKHQFLAAGAERLKEIPSGPAGAKDTAEQRRLQLENEQLKLALAEATVQLRIWQRAAWAENKRVGAFGQNGVAWWWAAS